jgi:hypothetical protein
MEDDVGHAPPRRRRRRQPGLGVEPGQHGVEAILFETEVVEDATR